jgi:hypothetical protein
MDEIETTTRRTRTPGIQYPGASLADVLNLLGVLEADGGEVSVGRIAARVEMAEGAANFKRLLISARAYGLAEWVNADKTVLGITVAGRKAAAGEPDELLRALIRPPAFRNIARKFAGRQLPAAGLSEPFKVAGVAPAGVTLAARNFEASADAAGAIAAEGGRRVLRHDLPFDAVDAEMPAAPAKAVTQAKATADAPPALSAPGGGRASRPRSRAGRVTTQTEPRPSRTDVPPVGGRGTERGHPDGDRPPVPSLNIAVQVYIDKEMSADQVDQVFASLAKHLYGRS